MKKIKIEDIHQKDYFLNSKDLTKEERSKLLIIIDSWGGLVTSKTIDDAINEATLSMRQAKEKL